MNTFINNRNLTIVNFSIVVYFCLLYTLYFFKIDIVLFGVFREILTIPFLLAQIPFLVLCIIHLIKHKIYLLTFISTLLLAMNTIYTFASFFY